MFLAFPRSARININETNYTIVENVVVSASPFSISTLFEFSFSSPCYINRGKTKRCVSRGNGLLYLNKGEETFHRATRTSAGPNLKH